MATNSLIVFQHPNYSDLCLLALAGRFPQKLVSTDPNTSTETPLTFH